MNTNRTKDATQTSEQDDFIAQLAGQLNMSATAVAEALGPNEQRLSGDGAAPVGALAEECKREARHLFNLTDDAEDMVHLSMAIDRLRDAAKTAYNTGRLDAWNEIRAARDTSPAACITGEPVAFYCEWVNGEWAEFRSADDMPSQWDDPPHKVTPLYAAPAGAPQDSAHPLLDKAANPAQDGA
jgi:hypothetical protein